MYDSPVIVASMFYKGDDLVLDAEKGNEDIDEQKTIERLKKTEKYSETYNVPFVIDIEIPSTALAPKVIRTIAKNSEREFWISSFNQEMRLAACKVAAEDGLTDRVYYSTLNYMSDDDEFRAVADLGLKPVIQVFNPDDPFPDGYLSKADELLNMAEKTGISTDNIVLLSTVLDFGTIPIALLTISSLKETFGLPVCIPSVGPIYKWAKEYSKDERRFILSSMITYTLDAGADLVHIGTMKRSFLSFPVVSLVDRLEKRKNQFL